MHGMKKRGEKITGFFVWRKWYLFFKKYSDFIIYYYSVVA